MKRITIRLPKDMHEELIELGDKKHVEVSTLIRRIIKNNLNKNSGTSNKIDNLSLKLDKDLNKLKMATQLIGETDPIISKKIKEIFS